MESVQTVVLCCVGSGFNVAAALHVIQNIHKYGPLQDIMTMLQHAIKGVHMYTLEHNLLISWTGSALL